MLWRSTLGWYKTVAEGVGSNHKESVCDVGDLGSIPGSRRPLGEGNGNPLHSWRIPWTEEPDRLQSMGSQRVGHNWATNTHTHTEWNERSQPFKVRVQSFPGRMDICKGPKRDQTWKFPKGKKKGGMVRAANDGKLGRDGSERQASAGSCRNLAFFFLL